MVPEFLGVPVYVWGGGLILGLCALMPVFGRWLYREEIEAQERQNKVDSED